MNQGGLKHAATESRLDSKRERRRGAAGRAAVLRRAPSDSDCSGETASLSADSGDRAVRPPPPPPRTGKSRSRRRGSEWEVLEGLKDGQRFEKRPEVFNGYLHKKRKWPLKGWHKRYFVVDGGILVYARSPTDVARGRLHGSVDVGLSVISAKARRRRIDIDADEFIYHLRAKTADVFRTWLNVLEAHRLYRQHLLTFGARESVPKIHAPLEDLPPTDTSSRTSHVSTVTSTSTSINDFLELHSCILPQDIPIDTELFTNNKVITDDNEDLRSNINTRNKIDCKTKSNLELSKANAPNKSLYSANTETQVLSTDFDLNSLYLSSEKNKNNAPIKNKVKRSLFPRNKIEPTAVYYFFTRKKNKIPSFTEPPMKRSKKSTNLIKYRNIVEEPRLIRPLSKCMLLGKCELADNLSIECENKGLICNMIPKSNDEVQVIMDPKKPLIASLQDIRMTSEYDNITERLMIELFEGNQDNDHKIRPYLKDIVKELYDVKVDHKDAHPIKILFRCLLEFWVKNTKGEHSTYCAKSIDIQSNAQFSKDKNLSSMSIANSTKNTQCHGVNSLIEQYQTNKNVANTCKFPGKPIQRNKHDKGRPSSRSPRHNTENYEKERRIEELERILKNTVYVCETVPMTRSKEKDILITKTLINNLEKLSRKSELSNSNVETALDNSNSSTELPKLQETLKHLISETSMPTDLAKEFFNAYLGVLLSNSSKSMTNSSSQSSDYANLMKTVEPICGVQTEPVQKKISKSILTKDNVTIDIPNKFEDTNSVTNKTEPVDSGQQYLKDILDKVTTIFSKIHNDSSQKSNITKPDVNQIQSTMKDELGRLVKEYPEKDIINNDGNAVIINLSKYDLEHISMCSNPELKGTMSITIKLRKKQLNYGESKRTHLNLKFSDEGKPIVHQKSLSWLRHVNSNPSSSIFQTANQEFRSPLDYLTANKPKDDLKPYESSNDSSWKPFCNIIHESEHTLDLSFKSNNNMFQNDPKCLDSNEDSQPCYLMSFKKNTPSTKVPPKKKVRLKECKGIMLKPDENTSRLLPNRAEEYAVFERPAPRVIDEKFILLLLENLTLLSKNLPGLYKDINCLYLKLKKKHEKIVRNSNTIQGLSLLGKIYNEDLNKATDIETQLSPDFCAKGLTELMADIATNTSHNEIVDRCISAYNLNDTECKETQTELLRSGMFLNRHFYNDANILSSSLTTQTSSLDTIHNKNEETLEQAISNQNWYKQILTKECAMSTIIKCLLNNAHSSHDFLLTKNPEGLDSYVQNIKNDKKLFTKVRQEIEDISLLSTNSQTERKILRDENVNNYNLFQILLANNVNNKCNTIISNSSGIRYEDSDMNTLYRCSSEPSFCSGLVSPTSPPVRGPQASFVSGTPGGRLASWIIESGGPLENASRELGQAQLSVQQLQRLMDALELQQQVHHDTDVSLEGASPNVKKDRRKFGLRKKKSNSKCASVELAPPHIDPSSSHMALSALTAPPSPGGGASSVPNSAASLPIACAAARPQSLPGAEALATGNTGGPASLTSLTPDHQLREDFTVLAKDLVASLKSIVATLVCERGRLRAAMEAADAAAPAGGGMLAALRTNLTSALHQNSELRSRLSRIHDASDLAEISSMGHNSDPANRPFQQSLSYSSSCVSASEFFDAEEHEEDDLKPEILAANEAGVIELDGDSSSEAGSLSSEEGSASSDNSDGAMLSAEQVTLRLNQNGVDSGEWTRRTRLPCTRPTPGGPSLWNLLYKNIGKDLSQVSMPVTINEPLNMLQRLCEELEYSELLDAASECKNGVERMALVAAFAVSAYASSAHRAASKPFNPLLAETYECIRDDKGFRFVAEQVSHHPPISACHAESSRWLFWQEARIKTKFWGKSMEFQPTGRVHVRLATTGDHYSWNKVTTCVHNLFGGQRWVDQYGDMHITCHGTDISCKLQFIKASSWSSSRHEVRGAVTDGSGTRLRLQGRWSEALHAGDPPAARCLWRPGAMPPEHELYYGFTRFAMELNEMEPGMRDALPHTDTRLRPDQRALEQGDVEAAEQFKLQVEQAQRERRRDAAAHTPAWFRKQAEGGEETWVFTGEYWKAREAAFAALAAPSIW